MMIVAPELPSPSEWGWNEKAEGGWEICWITMPEVTQVCRELTCCGCKKAVLDITSARKLPCCALSFVFAVDSAQIKYCNNNIGTIEL